MYQRIGKAAYKADLSNTIKLAAYLEKPENKFKSVHIAGTNGKGSTSHMLASVLQEAGYKVGLYTSPHLKDFRERIKINGKMIPKRTVSRFVNKHKAFFEANQLSFFEMTVGLAFDFFAVQKVDIAVVEVGLGGRLDGTNILTPEVSVITNIGLDHTRFLGNTYKSIATEKAGIIKPSVPVVIGETLPETKDLFRSIAEDRGAPISFAEDQQLKSYELDLKGEYQQLNARTVDVTIAELTKLGWKISERDSKDGLSKVIANTGLLGRWQLLKQRPKVICDTGHNKEGLTWVMKQLGSMRHNHLYIVLGVVSDKDLNSVLPLFPKQAYYYFCSPQIDRALSASTLRDKAEEYGLEGEVFLSVEIAYKEALRTAGDKDLIFIGGSTFVVAEVL